MANRTGEAAARRQVKERAGGRCEIEVSPHCTGRHEQFSHRKRRSQGGRWCAANGLAACAACHLAITDTAGRRAEYVWLGWLVNSTETPHMKPVRLGGRMVLIGPDGSVNEYNEGTEE